MVSNFYYEDHNLIVHVRRGMDSFLLILYDHGIFQVPLDVQILEKFENLPIFGVYLYFLVCVNRLRSFLHTSGLS